MPSKPNATQLLTRAWLPKGVELHDSAVARAELAEHAEVACAELAELDDGALVRRSSAPCARASVELPRWPGALSICRIGYRAGRSRSPVLWSTRVAVHMRVLHSRSRLQRQINVHLDRRRWHLGLANVVDLDVVDERNTLLIVSTGCLCTSWA